MLYDHLVSSDLRSFIRSLPKAETHLHMEGALPYERLAAEYPQQFSGEPEFLSTNYRFPDFTTFENILLAHAVPWFTSAERYHEAARHVFARHMEQNVRYVETSFHLGVLEITGMPGEEVIQAIKEAAPPGLTVRVFMGMLRPHYQGVARKIIDDMPNWKSLDGVDLHGHEDLPLEEWTARAWAEVRQAGKETKAHAGEFCGAENVRVVLDQLQVKRIQHGIGAADDPELVERLIGEGITLDICPVSNFKLRAVDNWTNHPLPDLLRRGVRCTVSTDDPLVIGNALNDEYAALSLFLGLSPEEMKQVARNGFLVATLDEAVRQACLKAIDELEAPG